MSAAPVASDGVGGDFGVTPGNRVRASTNGLSIGSGLVPEQVVARETWVA